MGEETIGEENEVVSCESICKGESLNKKTKSGTKMHESKFQE